MSTKDREIQFVAPTPKPKYSDGSKSQWRQAHVSGDSKDTIKQSTTTNVQVLRSTSFLRSLFSSQANGKDSSNMHTLESKASKKVDT